MQRSLPNLPDGFVVDILKHLNMLELLRMRDVANIDHLLYDYPAAIFPLFNSIRYMNAGGHVYNRFVRGAFGNLFDWLLHIAPANVTMAVRRICIRQTTASLLFDLTDWRTASINMQYMTIHAGIVTDLMTHPGI